jgi:hypothetical protein
MSAIESDMEQEFKYRGKIYTREDIDFIRQLIQENPNDSRRRLSQALCVAWNWVQKNGALRDMVCRSFMLELDRAGLIILPEKKQNPINNLAVRKKPSQVSIDQTAISGSLSDLKPINLIQVRKTESEPLCNSLIEQHHYLGYCQPVGEHLKYIAYSDNRPIACLTWSSPPLHIGSRDRFIGWPPGIRKQNLHLMAYNSRFLILPWVNVKYLASHLLSRSTKVVAQDWLKFYHHPIHYLETFVDTERYVGTCYYAANWKFLGKTTGRGIKEKTQRVTRSIKDVLGYPLSNDFRLKLCHGKETKTKTS